MIAMTLIENVYYFSLLFIFVVYLVVDDAK